MLRTMYVHICYKDIQAPTAGQYDRGMLSGNTSVSVMTIVTRDTFHLLFCNVKNFGKGKIKSLA